MLNRYRVLKTYSQLASAKIINVNRRIAKVAKKLGRKYNIGNKINNNEKVHLHFVI